MEITNVDWRECLSADSADRHRWFSRTFADYPHPQLDKPVEDRQLHVEYLRAGLRIALFGSAESGGEIASDDRRQQAEQLLKDLDSTRDEDAENRREVIDELERIDPGVVSNAMLQRLPAPAPGWLTIAAMHHPVSPVPSVEVTPYSGIVNAGQVRYRLSNAKTALILHGHTHLAFLSAERLLPAHAGQPTGDWTIRIAGAASLASAHAAEANGYNEVFIAREGTRDHSLIVRSMQLLNGYWSETRSVAFRAGYPVECAAAELVNDPVNVDE